MHRTLLPSEHGCHHVFSLVPPEALHRPRDTWQRWGLGKWCYWMPLQLLKCQKMSFSSIFAEATFSPCQTISLQRRKVTEEIRSTVGVNAFICDFLCVFRRYILQIPGMYLHIVLVNLIIAYGFHLNLTWKNKILHLSTLLNTFSLNVFWNAYRASFMNVYMHITS